jgi:hypothetical protein
MYRQNFKWQILCIWLKKSRNPQFFTRKTVKINKNLYFSWPLQPYGQLQGMGSIVFLWHLGCIWFWIRKKSSRLWSVLGQITKFSAVLSFVEELKKKSKFLHTFLEKIRFNPARTTVAFSQNELQIAFSPICGHMQTSRGLASSQIWSFVINLQKAGSRKKCYVSSFLFWCFGPLQELSEIWP